LASETKFKETEIGMIPEDWDIGELKDFCSKIGSGATPRGGSNVYIDSGIAFIRSQNVYDEGFKTEGLTFIQNSDAKKLNNVEVKKNDILLNITGDSICRCCIVPDSVLPARVNQHVSIIRTNTKLYYKFLYCYLCLKRTKEALLSFDAGGTRKAITKGNLEKLLLPLPNYIEQIQIGDFIGLINDKIDLNRQMNSTLEQIAQTLFKHWFIDFEFPDENGNPYKSSGGRMEDSELGEIPEGWEVGQIKDLVNHFKKSVKPQEEPDKLFHHYSIPAYDSGKVPEREFGSKIMSNKFKVVSNSILVSKLNPETERVWNVGYVDESLSICSTELQVFVSKQESWNSFVYFLFKSNKIREEMVCRVTGTSKSHQRISPQDILNIQIILPTKELILEFGTIFNVILKRINCNLSEAENLSQIRDFLLPKLMSGKIRVEC
jgi:type I restriction enzyme S subunit